MNISTKQHKKEIRARLQETDEHTGWPEDYKKTTSEGSQEVKSLKVTVLKEREKLVREGVKKSIWIRMLQREGSMAF